MADSLMVQNMIECSICTETFKTPKCLPCIHTFCLECLRSFVDTNKLNYLICRHPFTVPPGGVADLPDNFHIKQLIDARTGEGPRCQPCSTVYSGRSPPARTHCMECDQDLCQSCSTRHGNTTGTATHRLLTLGDWERERVIKESRGWHCVTHLGMKLQVYCWECKTTVCVMCWSVDHAHHEFCNLDEGSPSRLDTLEEEEP